MKTIFKAILFAVLVILPAACNKYDDSALKQEIERLDKRISDLEAKLNTDIDNLYRLLNSAIKDVDASVDSLANVTEGLVTVVEVTEKDGVTTVTLSDGSKIEVNPASEDPIVTVVEKGGLTYWALIGADGKVTELKDGKGNNIPTTHHDLTFKLDPNSREILYSIDGGTEWVNTGVVIPMAADSPIITNVVDNGSYVTFYIGTFSFDVAKMTFEHFEVLSGKQHFQPSQTKSVVVSIEGYKSHFVAYAPQGWDVDFDGESLEITSPDNTDPSSQESEGKVEIWVATQNGKMLVGSVNVVLGEPEVVITNKKVSGAYAASFDFASSGVYYGLSILKDFDKEELFSSIASGKYDKSSTSAQTLELKYADELGTEPKVGEVYVAWAYSPVYEYGRIISTEEDFIISFLSPVTVTLESVSKFNDVDLTIKVEGADSFYALAMEASMYADMGVDINALLNPAYGMSEGYIYDSDVYEGKYSSIGIDPAFDFANNIRPGSQYKVIIVPLNEYRSMSEYTNEDAYVFDVKTTALSSGGTAKVSLGTPTEDITYVSVPVTSEGVMTYYMYLTSSDLNIFNTDELIAGYLTASSNDVVQISTSTEFTAKKSADPETEFTFAAVAVDKDGKYGPLSKVVVKTKPMPEPEFEISAFVSDCQSNSVTIDVSVEGGTAYKYVYMNATWEADEYVVTDMISAFNGDGNYMYHVVDPTEELNLTSLSLGNEYFFYLMAFKEDGTCSNLVTLQYKTELSQELYVASSDPLWEQSKPEISVWGDEACTESELVKDGNFLDLYIKAVSNDKIAKLYFTYDYEVQLAGLEGKELLEKLLSLGYLTTTVTESMLDENNAYVKYYNVADDSVMRYVYWEDAEGRLYEPIHVTYEYTIGSATDPDEDVSGGSTEK